MFNIPLKRWSAVSLVGLFKNPFKMTPMLGYLIYFADAVHSMLGRRRRLQLKL